MKKFLIIIIMALIAIQFIKVDITKNTTPASEIIAPANIKAILQKSCYDCHSNSYKIPWYGDIAPSSWLVRSHINNGRKVLNFSEFNNYEKAKQKKLYNDIKKSIVLRMPLDSYILLHTNAKLTKNEKDAIKAWTIDAKNRL